MRALITRMNTPLGCTVGTAVEVAESIAWLSGNGPSDLVDLSVELAAEMVLMGERAESLEEARAICLRTIADGSALERFRRLIEVQGGDPRVIDDPSRLPSAERRAEVGASWSGVVQSVAARPIAHAAALLGAGRTRVESNIDPAVGVILHKKPGDVVTQGEPLCTALINESNDVVKVLALIRSAYVIDDSPVEIEPLIIERI
jgi:thymidine phosphorylase